MLDTRQTPCTDSPTYEAWVFNQGQIPYAWVDLEPFVVMALKNAHGELKPQDVFERLCNGGMKAFVTSKDGVIELLLVAEKLFYPGVTRMNIVLLAGKDLRRAEKFLPAFEAWALKEGAVEICGYVPPAASHARLYKRFGFEPIYHVVLKDLRGKLQ